MATISIAQIKLSKTPEVNCNKILEYIEKAKGSDVICFPEVSLNPEKTGEDVSKHIKKIQKSCKKNSIWCIFGSFVKDSGHLYNIIYLVDRNGKIKHKYKKNNLWLSENGVKPGKTNKVIETDFGKIGIIACWDFAFPEASRKLAQKGADIIFCPSYLRDHEGFEDVIRSFPVMRAFENLVYFVVCDAFNNNTAGKSFICSPRSVLGKIEGKEELVTRKLDLKELEKIRKYFRTPIS